MANTRKRVRLRLLSDDEDQTITAAAKADPDAQPLTRKQLRALVPIHAILGRPPLAQKKLLVSVRYSPDVIEWFKSTGDGWQSRMNAVLSRHVARKIRVAINKNVD